MDTLLISGAKAALTLSLPKLAAECEWNWSRSVVCPDFLAPFECENRYWNSFLRSCCCWSRCSTLLYLSTILPSELTFDTSDRQEFIRGKWKPFSEEVPSRKWFDIEATLIFLENNLYLYEEVKNRNVLPASLLISKA